GRLMDWLGSRKGFSIAVIFWSVAAMAHALASSAFGFGATRFALGLGESGNFPASIKTVAEWFPKKERALATGIFNSGTNIGAVVAYPIVGWLLIRWGWQTAFVATGGLGLLSLVLWLILYRVPQRHPWITEAELSHIEDREGRQEQDKEALPVPWANVLGYREAW